MGPGNTGEVSIMPQRQEDHAGKQCGGNQTKYANGS